MLNNQFILSFFIIVFGLFFACKKQVEKPVKTEGTTYKLYFLGGQSNMVGYGKNAELPDKYRGRHNNIRIFNGQSADDDKKGGGHGEWLPLTPGFGTGCSFAKNKTILSERFGPELSFGVRLEELTDDNIAIIKYARSGSSIALGSSGYGTWAKNYQENTTINQWDHFKRTVTNARDIKDIDGDGINDRLIPAGIVWMQGESDADDKPSADAYFENLSTLMNDINDVFGAKKLPITLCRIEDSGNTKEERVMPHIETVWNAQQQYAAKNKRVSLIQLDQPVQFLIDGWHYKSEHYIEMGEKFAEVMAKVNNGN